MNNTTSMGFSENPNEVVQEAFEAADGSFTDFMGGKFDYPKDQSSNHSQLKADQMPDQSEAGANALGYINKAPAYTPERPGKFENPFD